MTLTALALAVELVRRCNGHIENIGRAIQSGQGPSPGHPGWSAARLPCRTGGHSQHQHCVCTDVFPDGGGPLLSLVPLAEAVEFALFASYFFFPHPHSYARNVFDAGGSGEAQELGVRKAAGLFARIHRRFEHRLRDSAEKVFGFAWALFGARRAFAVGFLIFCVASLALVPQLGRIFFHPSMQARSAFHYASQNCTRSKTLLPLPIRSRASFASKYRPQNSWDSG